jgi:predicted NBD/HSP70 family sugar kinase
LHLITTPAGARAEFGQMTVEENGPLCCCGNNGCFEIMASCAAVIHAARSAIERGVDSKIRELVARGLERISIEINEIWVRLRKIVFVGNSSTLSALRSA